MEIEKRKYIQPEIETIKLDKEISLQLESNPPWGPGETNVLKSPDFYNNDPFKLA